MLTCDRDLPTFRIFTRSLRGVLPALSAPHMVVDTSASADLSDRYLRRIRWLGPAATHVHPRVSDADVFDSIQHAAHVALEVALAATRPGDLVLFVEDDIVFSRWFPAVVGACDPPPDAGFVTLYLPGISYPATLIDPPSMFYGTQCLLLPRSSVAELVDAHDEMLATPPGYDLRWSRYLASRGYRLYATARSLVQHVGTTRMGNADHCSNRFVP